MVFGMGTNVRRTQVGAVKGVQREIACECWFTSSGKIIPLLLKVKDEDGEIRVIRQIQIHSQEQRMYAGLPSVEFDCTLTILNQEIRVKLIYYQTESRWVLKLT